MISLSTIQSYHISVLKVNFLNLLCEIFDLVFIGYELNGLDIDDENCLSGTKCRKCSDKGVWGDGMQKMAAPTCTPISCDHPPEIINAE